MYNDLLVEDKNTHLEHLEDDIINNGYAGGENAVNFLKATADLLSGNSTKSVNVTVKWDGAPAIVCGPSPENGKFFVGTKSVFNKTPKINYTVQDIKNNHTGEVANILQDCLRYLSTLGLKEILQGDLLYRQGTVKKTTYKSASGKSEQMLSFQPNTIVYMVPEASGLGRKINSSKLGIIFPEGNGLPFDRNNRLTWPTLNDVGLGTIDSGSVTYDEDSATLGSHIAYELPSSSDYTFAWQNGLTPFLNGEDMYRMYIHVGDHDETTKIVNSDSAQIIPDWTFLTTDAPLS